MRIVDHDRMTRPGDLNDRIGRAIAARRRARGLTQEELARLLTDQGLRIGRSGVAMHETGAALSVEKLARYAKALGDASAAEIVAEAEEIEA